MCFLASGTLPKWTRSSSGAVIVTSCHIVLILQFSRSNKVLPHSMPKGETLQSLALLFGVSLQHLALVNPTLRKPFATLPSLFDVQLGIRFRVNVGSNVTAVLSNIRRALGCSPRLLSPIIFPNTTKFGVDSVCVVPDCSK